MNHKGLPAYVLKLTNVLIVNENDERMTMKKWSKVPFYKFIQPLEAPPALSDSSSSDSEDDLYNF